MDWSIVKRWRWWFSLVAKGFPVRSMNLSSACVKIEPFNGTLLPAAAALALHPPNCLFTLLWCAPDINIVICDLSGKRKKCRFSGKLKSVFRFIIQVQMVDGNKGHLCSPIIPLYLTAFCYISGVPDPSVFRFISLFPNWVCFAVTGKDNQRMTQLPTELMVFFATMHRIH